MKILVISQTAWNTTNSFGNTVTNWFDGWNDSHFYHFYTRQQEPNTRIVDRFFRVTEADILKKGLSNKDIGISFNSEEIANNINNDAKQIEQKYTSRLHKSKHEIIYFGIEQLWLLKKWITEPFLQFVDEVNPDIVFAFAYAPYILAPAIECIKRRNEKVKIILHVADDVLEAYCQTAWYRRRYLIKQLDNCIYQADKLYAASEAMANKYRDKYHKEFTPLYKGCAFEYTVKEKQNKPIKLVYAGNLLYGRAQTLSIITNALHSLNTDEVHAFLEIYSNTTLSEKEKGRLNDLKNSFYMGTRPYDEIKKILNQADVVLHVESFEESQKKVVKYSFSTKIIDCLQSGSCVMAIGPKGLASIDYFNRVDGAIVINEMDQIEHEIYKLIHDKDTLLRARSTREYAFANHEIGVVRKKLKADFESLLQS